MSFFVHDITERNTMRRMRKTRILAVCLSMLLLLSGCSSQSTWMQESREKKNVIKIGVSIYDEYDFFTASIVSYVKEWCKKTELEQGKTITVEVVGANKNQLTQNDQIEKFVEKEFDVICVNLVDRTNAMVVIDKAKKADIPIIFWNRELVEEDMETWSQLYYVGSQPEQSAVMQAQLVIDALTDPERFAQIDRNGDGVIQYVILEGERGHQDALVRTQVSIEEIKNAGIKVEKLGDEFANWNRDLATTKMNAFLDEYPDQIEMIVANDDNMALGAVDALELRNMEGWPLIVGVNGQSEVLELIKRKKMEGTVYHDAVRQGEAIAKIAYALVTGTDIPEEIGLTEDRYVYVPYSIVNYDNIEEYIRDKTY